MSLNRRTLLDEAREKLLKHRPENTPVLLAKNLGRENESILYRSLNDFSIDEVDMLTVVIIGS